MAEPTLRYATLDGLRGIAVMGILLMNVTGFALPQAAYLNPAAYGGTAPSDIAVWMANFVLVDGKMRALFSFLFGASMLLVFERAEDAGRSGAMVHFRRMASLLLMGLIHAYLIWDGDILVLYAIIGMVAFGFVGLGSRALVTIGIVLLVVQMLLLASLMQDLADLRDAAARPHAAAAAVQAWRNVADEIGIPTPAAIARTLAIYRGGYGGIVHERLTTGIATPILQFVDVGAETLGLMLLGMAGLRSGFLTGAWRRPSYARVALATYGIGLPALALIAAGCMRSGFDEVGTVRAAELLAAPFRPIVMLGHASLALLWLGRRPADALTVRVVAAGRMAFSNYLGTSIAMTCLFYGYGGGLFGTIGRARLYLLVPLAWAAMLLWSKPWLDRYRYGPLEWLWRSLARGTPQMMRKAIATKSQQG